MGKAFKQLWVEIKWWECVNPVLADGVGYNPYSVVDWQDFVNRVGSEEDKARIKERLKYLKKPEEGEDPMDLVAYTPKTLPLLVAQQLLGLKYTPDSNTKQLRLDQLAYWGEKKQLLRGQARSKMHMLTDFAAKICLRDACLISIADADAVVMRRLKVGPLKGHVPLNEDSAVLAASSSRPRTKAHRGRQGGRNAKEKVGRRASSSRPASAAGKRRKTSAN